MSSEKTISKQSPDTPSSNEIDPWEEAYNRFETPQEEIQKFAKRLEKLGASSWPRDAQIVELFCGHGNGLHALEGLGFKNLEGADLSAALLARYTGNHPLYECDCRQLPFPDNSRDILIVQGGLHHLPTLPDDLEQALREMHRVVKEDGRVVIVEPWLTSFLKLTHVLCHNPLVRRSWDKMDALATMIHYEQRTYDQWLGRPKMVKDLLDKFFKAERCEIGWGKIMFVGRKK